MFFVYYYAACMGPCERTVFNFFRKRKKERENHMQVQYMDYDTRRKLSCN
jgi:hypothetical protein